MTHLTVFGASGLTGREVVRQASDLGHEVRAITRDPAKLAGLGAEVRAADVLDRASLRGILEGSDAVISALGPDDGRRPTQVYSRGMKNIIEEMHHSGIRRVVAVSAVPVSAAVDKTMFERFVLHPVLWHFFGESYRDLRTMESELAQADQNLEWVVVRPPLLTDDTADGSVRSAWDQPLRRTRKVSRRLLARTLLATATADPFRHGVLTITQS